MTVMQRDLHQNHTVPRCTSVCATTSRYRRTQTKIHIECTRFNEVSACKIALFESFALVSTGWIQLTARASRKAVGPITIEHCTFLLLLVTSDANHVVLLL